MELNKKERQLIKEALKCLVTSDGFSPTRGARNVEAEVWALHDRL